VNESSNDTNISMDSATEKTYERHIIGGITYLSEHGDTHQFLGTELFQYETTPTENEEKRLVQEQLIHMRVEPEYKL
jgi:hypothetical protein